MGQSGAIAILILLFLAVTSACSAEQIAVSSLLTYDIYGTYINPNPSEKQILYTSHACILGYALFMGAIATAFNYIGVSMGYLYELMGCIIGSSISGVALCITWRKCNGTGAVVGAIVGFIAAIGGWVGITSSLNDGVVNVTTTFGDYEMLTGNLLAIGVGGLITVGWSLIRPANFDWEITRRINVKTDTTLSEDDEEVAARTPGVEQKGEEEKGMTGVLVYERTGMNVEAQLVDVVPVEDDRELQTAFRFASWSALTLTAILIFVRITILSRRHTNLYTTRSFPSRYFPHRTVSRAYTVNYQADRSTVYPKQGFTAWVCISIIWLFVGLAMVGIYPMWEARKGLAKVGRGIAADLSRKNR
jgi:hypothetical protein